MGAQSPTTMGAASRAKRPSLAVAAASSSSFFCLLLVLVPLAPLASGHGYLSSPHSRNPLAFQDTVWWPLTENDPEPETCPHCLNRGGSRMQCEISEDPQGARNYDSPKNALGWSMPPMVQATYNQGQEVVPDVTLTAHHKVSGSI